jgi:hypothetical protein
MKRYNALKSILLLSGVLCAIGVSSQNGMYMPPNADFSYPRTLLDAKDLNSIRATLHEAEKKALYVLSWNTAQLEENNNSASEKRMSRAVIAYEAGFVLLMGLKPEGSQLVPLVHADSVYLVRKAIQYLEQVEDKIEVSSLPSWTYYNPWQGNAKELNQWLHAYDFLKGAGVPDGALLRAKKKLQGYVGNYCMRTQQRYPDPITGLPTLDFFDQQPNNHAIMATSILGLGAIVLNDVDSTDINYKPNRWMNVALWNIDNVMWRMSFPFMRVSSRNTIAGYYEGPSYFDYAFDNAMPFFRALWNFIPDGTYPYAYKNSTRQIRHPWYDPNYKNLAVWMNRIRMPNGTYPAIHESGMGLKTNVLVYWSNPSYNIPYEDIQYYSYRVPYLCANVGQGVYQDSLFQVLPDAGSVVFRSDYAKKEATYMHLIAKNNESLTGAKAHHQGDATSFELYYNGEIMALDPGYPGAPFRAATNKPTDHNLVLVNGNGPDAPITQYASLNNAVDIENNWSLGKTDYTELASRWGNADLRRRVLFPHRQYFIVTDYMAAPQINSYTWQLHGHGLLGGNPNDTDGAFTHDFDNNIGVYTRKNTNLYAMTLGSNPVTHTVEADSLAAGWNTYRMHSKWLVTQEADTASFLSVLFPFENPNYPQIKNISDKTGCNAMAIFNNGYNDVVVSQAHPADRFVEPLYTGFPKHTGSNGLFWWASAKNRHHYTIFAQQATRVYADSTALWRSSRPVNLLWQADGNGHFDGHISDSAVVDFYMPFPIVPAVLTDNIADYEWLPLENVLRVYFHQSGYFHFISEVIKTTVPQEALKTLQINPNPALEQTQIAWNSPTSDRAVLTISDINGRMIRQENDVPVLVGMNEYRPNLANFTPGVYSVKIRAGKWVWTGKFVKI